MPQGDGILAGWVQTLAACGDIDAADAATLLSYDIWHDLADVGSSGNVRLTFSADVGGGSVVSRQRAIVNNDWNDPVGRRREAQARQLLQVFTVAVV